MIIKIIDKILLFIVSLLLIFSTLALVSIHLKLYDYDLIFSAEGFDLYLNTFTSYKLLFSGAIISTTTYFGLLRIKVSVDANIKKNKQDYFEEWKTVLEMRSEEVQEDDPKMVSEVMTFRYSLYSDLYDLGFSIQNKKQLETIFLKYFNCERLLLFEKNNKITRNEINKSVKHNSFKSFEVIFICMLHETYEDFNQDLISFYLKYLYMAKLLQ